MNQYFCTNTAGNCNPCATQQVDSCGCGCREDFRSALGLLCCPQTSPLINFNAVAFIADNYVVGTTITTPVASTTAVDNLNTLTGTYVCSSSSCETTNASGDLALAVDDTTPVAVNISQAALCKLNAVVFTAAGTTETEQSTNFQSLTQLLSQLINPSQPDSCCCSTIATSLLNATVARSVTLTAGPLLLSNVTVLGQIGDVLVLANSTTFRIYLVCADKIAFLG